MPIAIWRFSCVSPSLEVPFRFAFRREGGGLDLAFGISAAIFKLDLVVVRRS